MCTTSSAKKATSDGRQPTAEPPFTFAQLKAAIPAHCFKRSALKSGAYLVRDLLIIAALWYAALYINTLSPKLQFILWPLYWIAQGAFMTGVWVIAHECGHQAFSDSQTINNTVGMITHSALLVPYHSWRISHGKHHKWTAHVEHDEVFVPPTDSEVDTHHEDLPIVTAMHVFFTLTIGWPLYLTLNSTGPKKYRGVRADHFTPTSAIFSAKNYQDIQLSDFGLVVWVGILAVYSYQTSVLNMVFMYFIPYLFVNFWLVLITFLQHTDATVPHYSSKEWTWLRGAIATVDRDYGIMNHILHRITDTHVTHHLFSTMPFYHAEEATNAIKPILGDYYLRDDTPIAVALWRSFRNCRFIKEHEDIAFYHKVNDQPTKKAVKSE